MAASALTTSYVWFPPLSSNYVLFSAAILLMLLVSGMHGLGGRWEMDGPQLRTVCEEGSNLYSHV